LHAKLGTQIEQNHFQTRLKFFGLIF